MATAGGERRPFLNARKVHFAEPQLADPVTKPDIMPDSAPAPQSRVSLRQRVLNAGSWSLAGHFIGQAIRFGTNLLMTRLLVPDMFGIMAIAMVLIVGLAMFSDIGLKPNIVQSRRGDDPAFLNTAWAVQILRGALIWAIAVVVALGLAGASHLGLTPAGSVYADARLPPVIAVLALTVLINGFNSTRMFQASRYLALGRITLIEIGAQIAGLLCTLAWIAVDRSIWALVAGSLCWSAATMAASHLFLPGVANRWQWDRRAVDEIMHFGKWLFAAAVLSFLVTNGDRLLLGGLADAGALGVYSIAFMLVSALDLLLIKLVESVMFPALSEIARERPAAIKDVYYRLHALAAGFAYFCAGALITCGEALIHLLYDRRYEQAGWMLQILAVSLLASPFQLLIRTFMAMGRPQLNTYYLAFRLALLAIALPFGFYLHGLPGALWGNVLSQVACVVIILTFSVRGGLFDLWRELRPVPLFLVGLAAGSLGSWVIRALW